MRPYEEPVDIVGTINESTFACSCGDRHTTKTKRVPSRDNPGSLTSIIDWPAFTAQREWMRVHRAHGIIHQVAP